MKRKLSMAFIAVAIMSLALVISPVFGGNGNGQQGLERAIAAQEKHTDEYWPRKGWSVRPWA